MGKQVIAWLGVALALGALWPLARALDALGKARAPEAWLKLVAETVELTRDDEARVLGDTLPVGLLL